MIGQLICKGLSEESDKKNRDSLLQVLLDRFLYISPNHSFFFIINYFRDVNAYTRSQVIKTWSLLTCARKIPLKWYQPVTQAAVDRLQDKTQQVRC